MTGDEHPDARTHLRRGLADPNGENIASSDPQDRLLALTGRDPRRAGEAP